MSKITETARNALSRSNLFLAWSHELGCPSTGIRYTYIPKNGCSSVKLTLGIAEGWLRLGDDPHSISIRDRLVGKWQTPRSAARIAIVRDPVSRLTSAFLDRFSKPADDALDSLVKQGLLQSTGGGIDAVTFRDFVQHLSVTDARSFDAHWRPQTHFLAGKYDHLFHFEELRETFDFLRGLGLTIYSHDPHSTSKYAPFGSDASGLSAARLRSLRLNDGVAPRTCELVTSDIERRIRRIYAADFALLADIKA